MSAIADTTVNAPLIAMDADGDFVVMYVRHPNATRSMFVQRFDENGLRQGAPLPLTTDGYVGDIAMAPGGDFVATWTHTGNLVAQPFDDVYAARFSAAGIAQGGIFLVNETISGNQNHPSVSLDADGNAVFSWQATQAILNHANHPHEVFARKFAADGEPITTEFQVNPDQPANLYWSTHSADPNGNFAVVWGRDTFADGLPDQIYGQRFAVVSELTPAVGDDAYSIDEDGVLNVPAAAGLLSNDNDTDGDGVASDFDGDTIPDVSDPDDDNDGTPDGSENLVGRTDMMKRIVNGPAHGMLTLNADGSFTYEPDADHFGADSFTYRVVEPNFVVSGLATVALTVDSVNDAPSIIGSDVFSPVDPGARELVDWAVFDPGAANEAGQTHTYNVLNVTNPGLFAVPPQLAANGTLTFDIAAGQAGTATFDVQVSDNGGTANGGQDTAVQTFTIEVGNDLGPIHRSVEHDIAVSGTAGADTLEITGNVAAASLLLEGSLGSFTVLDVFRNVSVDMQGGGGSLNVHGLYLAGGLSITGSGGGAYDIGTDGVVSTQGDFLLSLASGTNAVNVLNLYIAGNINLFTGSGPDTLNLRDSTNPNFILSLSSGGTTVIATGEGSDGLNVRYGFIVGGFVINTGGNDDVVNVYGSAISGNVAVLGGAGDDWITIDTNYLVALLQMYGESDDDTLWLLNCIHVGAAEISGDSGADRIIVQNETAPRISIAGGGDQDLITFVSSLVGEIFAQLGDGDDLFSLYGNTVRRFSTFDGGPGGDLFDNRSSFLGGFSLVNFEGTLP